MSERAPECEAGIRKHASLVVVVLAIGACHTPAPRLQLAFAGPGSQACPSTDCSQVPMNCESVLSIRIVDPADASAPYLSQCVSISPQHGNMCSLASVDLESSPLPVRDLEVQVAVYPATAIQTDPMNPDVLLCPTNVEYNAATGFPVEQSPTPALGGQAFYHPGDQTVVVTLGCTDLGMIDQSCIASNQVTVTAGVNDFSTGLSVTGGSSGVADRLWISVGEPSTSGPDFVLGPADTRLLERTSAGPSPKWGGTVDLSFRKFACIQVLEDAAQSTASLHCRVVTATDLPELTGVWLAKARLEQEILPALGLGAFPDEGLTLGVVVDDHGKPINSAVVSSSMGTVEYLPESGNTIGAGSTSSSGIFLSRDAVFGTEFSTGGALGPREIGGLVAGKLTIVVLALKNPMP